MKKRFRKIVSKTGCLILVALSAIVLAQPVAANNCETKFPTNDVQVEEGDDAVLRIKVNCDTRNWTFRTFRYSYRTVDGSAKSSHDYRGKLGAHVFHPSGGPNYTRTTSVKIKTDNRCEGDEKFTMKYTLEGKTKAGWTDWSHGVGGLRGSFAVTIKIYGQADC